MYILGLKDGGKNISEIAKAIGRSRKAISHQLKSRKSISTGKAISENPKDVVISKAIQSQMCSMLFFLLSVVIKVCLQ